MLRITALVVKKIGCENVLLLFEIYSYLFLYGYWYFYFLMAVSTFYYLLFIFSMAVKSFCPDWRYKVTCFIWYYAIQSTRVVLKTDEWLNTLRTWCWGKIGMTKICFHGCKKNVFKWLIVITRALLKGYNLFSVLFLSKLCQHTIKSYLSDNQLILILSLYWKCPKSNSWFYNIGQLTYSNTTGKTF